MRREPWISTWLLHTWLQRMLPCGKFLSPGQCKMPFCIFISLLFEWLTSKTIFNFLYSVLRLYYCIFVCLIFWNQISSVRPSLSSCTDVDCVLLLWYVKLNIRARWTAVYMSDITSCQLDLSKFLCFEWNISQHMPYPRLSECWALILHP